MRKTEKEKENENIKEDFCGACISVPIAMAGATLAGASTKKGKTNKKVKKIMFFVGITITILALIAAVIYLKKCKSCR